MAYFAVIVERAEAWDWTLPMRKQRDWDEHAAFMDRLGDERFIVAGGPLGGEDAARSILHVIAAPDEAAVRKRLAEDVWHRTGLLKLISIERWTVLIGSIA